MKYKFSHGTQFSIDLTHGNEAHWNTLGTLLRILILTNPAHGSADGYPARMSVDREESGWITLHVILHLSIVTGIFIRGIHLAKQAKLEFFCQVNL